MLNLVKFFAVAFLGLILASCTLSSTQTNPSPTEPPPHEQDPHAHHHAPAESPAPPAPAQAQATPSVPYVIALKPLSPIAQERPATFQLQILGPNGQELKHKHFQVIHGKRIHALIIDPAMLNYQHIHLRPETAESKALYEFTLTPTQAGEYKIYLDLVDDKNKQYFVETHFTVPGHALTPKFDPSLAKGRMQTQVQANGLNFTVEAPLPISANEHVMLNFTVKQGDELFRKLEPTMQAYAHLVGFNADRTELIHAHPMGEEPRSSNQRGGPNLKFGVDFPKRGNYRLFLQIKVDGKDVFVPFDVKVL